MPISKETTLCISVAERPGNFGSIIMNTCFAKLSLDFIYKPLMVKAEDLSGAVTGVRALGIRGCGVSMPHKISILPLLDTIDAAAQKVGAVNTVVNNGGHLTGYNTDFAGVKKALETQYATAGKEVFIVGAGGAARAIIVALQELGAGKITLTNRDEAKGMEIAKAFGVCYHPYDLRHEFVAQLFINATPVGMMPEVDQTPISEESIGRYEAVMDVVVNPPKTKLISLAEQNGKITIPGPVMALYQASIQFTLYTGLEAPLATLQECMDTYFAMQKINT